MVGDGGAEKAVARRWARPERWTVVGWVIFFSAAILFGFSSAARSSNPLLLSGPGMALGVGCWLVGLLIGVRDLLRRERREAALLAVLGSTVPLLVLALVATVVRRTVL